MKAFKLKIILLTFGTIFFSSCTKLLFTSLDVLRPAKVAFESNATNVLLVNNAIIQPSNIGHTTQLVSEKIKNETVNTDSLALFALGALKEDLESKNFFSSIQLSPNYLNTSTNFGSINYLANEKINELSKLHGVDVVISLDKIKVKDDITEFAIAETGSYLSTFEVKYESSWSIHYPNKPEFNAIQFKDTIYWETESYFRNKGIKELPNRADALIDGALYVGQKTVNRLVPYWEKVDRYFFNPNKKLFKQAMDSVYVKNWKSAIITWDLALNKSKSNWIKAQAANNIAIAYEIDGNVDKALEYATHSYYYLEELSFVDYNSYFRISDYINELTKRKKEIALLKSQLGE